MKGSPQGPSEADIYSMFDYLTLQEFSDVPRPVSELSDMDGGRDAEGATDDPKLLFSTFETQFNALKQLMKERAVALHAGLKKLDEENAPQIVVQKIEEAQKESDVQAAEMFKKAMDSVEQFRHAVNVREVRWHECVGWVTWSEIGCVAEGDPEGGEGLPGGLRSRTSAPRTIKRVVDPSTVSPLVALITSMGCSNFFLSERKNANLAFRTPKRFLKTSVKLKTIFVGKYFPP